MNDKIGKTCWFWSTGGQILSGKIHRWLHVNPITKNSWSDGYKRVANIQCDNGSSIHIPENRLFYDKGECISALRELKINKIL
jgi:hypothetical protein